VAEVVGHQDRGVHAVQAYFFSKFPGLQHNDFATVGKPVCAGKTGAVVNHGAAPAHLDRQACHRHCIHACAADEDFRWWLDRNRQDIHAAGFGINAILPVAAGHVLG